MVLEISDPKIRISELESKIKSLSSELNDAKKLIRSLEEKLIQSMEVDSHGLHLEKLKVDILLFLSKQKGEMTADEVASRLGINPQIALHHLTELNKKVIVLRSSRVNTSPSWGLSDEGRKYLININIIS